MKKLLKIIACMIVLCCVSPAFAEDSTMSPQGAATQPDIDQQGSDILNVGNLDTDTLEAGSATVSGGVSAGSVSTTNGAITTLNTNTTYIQSSPTSDTHGANKAYVDSQDSALDTRISSLESDTGGSFQTPSYTKKQYVQGSYYNLYQSCPSGYTLFYGHGITMGTNSTGNGNKTTYYLHPGFCVPSTAVRNVHYSILSTSTNSSSNSGGGR